MLAKKVYNPSMARFSTSQTLNTAMFESSKQFLILKSVRKLGFFAGVTIEREKKWRDVYFF